MRKVPFFICTILLYTGFLHPSGAAGLSFPLMLSGANLTAGIGADGRVCQLESRSADGVKRWLNAPLRITLRDERGDAAIEPIVSEAERQAGDILVRRTFPAQGGTDAPVEVTERWMKTGSGLALESTFLGKGARAGREIVLEFPVLSPRMRVFTPTERGTVFVKAHPDFKTVVYGTTGYTAGMRWFVLPLVSVFDPDSDRALTIALPPDMNIPRLQVEWSEGTTLRIRLGHCGMGGGRKFPLKLLLYSHPADYRSVLRAYSDDYPRYFRPVIPPAQNNGAFIYHHIQAYPDFEEMARQNVKNIWTSFWFTHLGEYLPAETEWYPFTYAIPMENGKPLGETMSDAKIHSFCSEMKAHDIGVYAYFNMAEYGSKGGKDADRREVEKKQVEVFGGDMIRLESGRNIETWEGATAMNPRNGSAFRAHLMEQARRHSARFPELQGFVVDRLDWSGPDRNFNPEGCDFSKSDGLTMVGDHEAENMAIPLADAFRELCRLAHDAGKQVYVNQFWRVEVLRDADAHIHEHDYIRGLGYVSPYRPVSAWVSNNYSRDDLVTFEAQIKRRLQFAVFPQMVAHTFRIIQQAPNPRAADLLELYTPLFAELAGKEQVLRPHCIEVAGANEANLFVNPAGNYIVPVTSRYRFLTRGHRTGERTVITLRVPDARSLRWAQVYSADGAPYRADVEPGASSALITLPRHVSSSVVVIGRGAEPPLKTAGNGTAEKVRAQFISTASTADATVGRLPAADVERAEIRIMGMNVEYDGKLLVRVDGKLRGELALSLPDSIPSSAWYTSTNAKDYSFTGTIDLPLSGHKLPNRPPRVELICCDEGVWPVLEELQLLVTGKGGKKVCIARWIPEFGATSPVGEKQSFGNSLSVQLRL